VAVVLSRWIQCLYGCVQDFRSAEGDLLWRGAVKVQCAIVSAPRSPFRRFRGTEQADCGYARRPGQVHHTTISADVEGQVCEHGREFAHVAAVETRVAIFQQGTSEGRKDLDRAVL